MILLPIVVRELRVAARKRSTFWLRIIAALVALLIGGAFLLLTRLSGSGGGTVSLGKGLFATLTWMSLGVALTAGLFFTSDCLSEEKREGTLGFLFLTDLRGFDVVLGKLLATSLRGAYALLAVFPILAITLLMGGVTGLQFWQTMLALLNALFLSLSVGLFVSAISRDSQKALAATLILLVLLVALGPAIDAVIAGKPGRGFEPGLALTSPGYLFVSASAWGHPPYWTALLVNQIVAWATLGLACLLLPRAWQEKPSKASRKSGKWSRWWKFGGPGRRTRLRQKLIDTNAVLWLACRERWQAATLWLVTLLLAGSLLILYLSEGNQAIWMFSQFMGGLLTLVLYLGIASQAPRFFVEARRGGLIELLLATPLTGKQIVDGQWRALLRLFGPPLVLFLTTTLVVSIVGHRAMWANVAAATPPTPPPTIIPATNSSATSNVTIIMTNKITVNAQTGGATATVSGNGFEAPGWISAVITSVASTLVTVANLAALIWFGMWMGLTSKSTNLATLKTIVFVQVIPWFVLTIASGIIVPLLLLPRLMGVGGSNAWGSSYIAWYTLLTAVFSLALHGAKDVGFILWARKRLYSDFRVRATEMIAPVRPVPRAPTPPPLSPPPPDVTRTVQPQA